MTNGLDGFVERYGAESAEVAWLAGLAWIERAVQTAREGNFGRFRWYPTGELRRLRRDLHGGLLLCRFAVSFQEEENEQYRSLTVELEREAAAAAARRRREGTREAERVRLVRQKARREGREPTEEELRPWLHPKQGRRRRQGNA